MGKDKSKIASWAKINKKIKAGITISLLEKFVYDYEPIEDDNAHKFRKSLQKVITELLPDAPRKPHKRTKPEKRIRNYSDKCYRWVYGQKKVG